MQRSVYGVAAVALLAVLAEAGAAAAQDAGDVGVVVGYPAAIGVVWHVTEGLAVRPDLSVTWTSSETTNTSTLGGATTTSTTSVDSVNAAIGLSALLYVQTVDRFRLYVVPRVAYLRSSQDLEGGLTENLDTTSDGLLVSGGLGGQFAAHDRFTIFGELGVQYTSQSSSVGFSSSRNDNENRSLGLRSAVGVTLYF